MKKLWSSFEKQKKRTKFTIVSIINIEIFTVVCLVLSFLDKEFSDVLVEWFFKSWTFELAILFGIKITDKRE